MASIIRIAGHDCSTPRAAVEKLLQSLFTPPDLVVWLRQHSGLSKAVTGLPSSDTAPSEFCSICVDRLEKRGELDTEFFELLEAEFPKRAEDIGRAMEGWLGVTIPVARRRMDTSTVTKRTELSLEGVEFDEVQQLVEYIGGVCKRLSGTGFHVRVDVSMTVVTFE